MSKENIDVVVGSWKYTDRFKCKSCGQGGLEAFKAVCPNCGQKHTIIVQILEGKEDE